MSCPKHVNREPPEEVGKFYFFRDSEVHGVSIGNVPYIRSRKSLSLFQRCCGEQMRLFLPRPDVVDGIPMVGCDVCQRRVARYDIC